MLGNDISNKQAPYIMFDIDSLMFLPREKTVISRITDLFKTEEKKTLESDIDPIFSDTLQRVWDNNNVCIGLVTFDLLNEKEALEEKLDKQMIPYTRIFQYTDWEQLRYFNRSIYTFSANEELISYLSRKDAMHISRIWEVLR